MCLRCRVRLELFSIWVWEPLSSTHLIRPFLMALRKLSRTTNHRALGFQTDGWSCGFQSLNIAKSVVEHRGTFSDVSLVQMGAGFVDYVLSIVNADRAVRVVEAPGDDVEGVTELPRPFESPPAPKLKVLFWLSRRVFRPPPPHSKARRPPASKRWKAWRVGRPSMGTPTDEDTRPKVLICGQWRKVPDGYPEDAFPQVGREQLLINDLSKQLVAKLRAACPCNPNRGAKPKASDTKTDLIYKRALCNYL